MNAYTEFSQIYDLFFPFKETVYKFLTSSVPAARKNVLDIGCGTGRYCQRFAGDGFNAVGIDPDEGMIQKAEALNSSAFFYQLPAQQIDRLEEKFDLVFSIGNSMSHIDRKDWNEFLPKLRQRMNPGGRWLFQMVNWDAILGRDTHTFPAIKNEESGMTLYRSYLDFSKERLIFKIEIRNANNKLILRPEQMLYPLSAEKCISIHENYGLKLKIHYGDFSRYPFYPATSSASIFVFDME